MSRRYPEGSGGWGAASPRFLPSHYRYAIDNYHDVTRYGPIDGLRGTLNGAPEGSAIHGWRRGTWGTRSSLDDPMGDGENLSPSEFESRISSVVAASEVGAQVVSFDLFPNQQPDELSTSRVKLREVGDQWEVRNFSVRLPEIDLSSRDVYGTMNQLGNYLEQGPTLPINNGVSGSSNATIFQDVPYLVRSKSRGGWRLNTCISGRAAAFVEEIVDTFVNESTADTLDEYSTEISGPGTYHHDPSKW